MIRRPDHDVTDCVCIARPAAVCAEVSALLGAWYPDFDQAALVAAFQRFSAMYAGTLAGFAGCDTPYHDAQHSLDCALATARLIAGHHRAAGPDHAISAARALQGCVIALFHDCGYVRRSGDCAGNGAVYTLTHVTRSGEALRQHFEACGCADVADWAAEMVHFTGYEKPLDQVAITNPRDRQLGFFIGTADLLAQFADACYPEKCRDFLFGEFETCGLAGPKQPDGPTPLYADRLALLNSTPTFFAKLRADRLDGYFERAWRYLDVFFDTAPGTQNPYWRAIADNLERVDAAIARQDLALLTRTPAAVMASALDTDWRT